MTRVEGSFLMHKRLMILVPAALLLALAGCSSGSPAPGASSGQASGSSTQAASSAVLATASTSLGTVVVDGRGRTVYVFDEDEPGSGRSACTGACASQWPAVETGSATPAVEGVTGTVATITGVDGKRQVTLDGSPLYTYAGDTSAGDATGQGVGGSWWVVAPDGSRIGASTPGNGSESGNGSGYSK